MTKHLVVTHPAVRLHGERGAGQHVYEVRALLTERVEDAERDVEFPHSPKGGRQPAQAAAELPDGGLAAPGLFETKRRQDLAQAARSHTRAVQGLDIAVERRGQITFERVDAARERALRQGCSHRRGCLPRPPRLEARQP